MYVKGVGIIQPNSENATAFEFEMTKVVVVFDFDRTLIDGDSDNWVVVQMGLTPLFHHLRSTLPWTSLMDRMMKELHSLGKTLDDIANCLKLMPLDPHVISAIKSAHSLGYIHTLHSLVLFLFFLSIHSDQNVVVFLLDVT